jgi:hypothetical protein
VGLLGDYCTSAFLEGTKDQACEMPSREELQTAMEVLTGKRQTRGGVPVPRSKTVDQTKGKTETASGSGSVSLHTGAAPVGAGAAGGGGGGGGGPNRRQRGQNYISTCVGVIGWLVWAVLFLFVQVVQWVWRVLVSWCCSILRYYLVLVMIFIFAIYFGTYQLQQWDSKIQYWSFLPNSSLTTLSHKTICHVIFIQIPGFEICPRPPAAIRNSLQTDARDQGQRLGLENQCLASNPYVFYPPFEAAFDDQASTKDVPAYILRQIGFQEKIDWWAAQPRKYANLDDDLIAQIGIEELLGLVSENSETCYIHNSSSTLLVIQKQIHALKDHIEVMVDALRALQGNSARFEATFEATIKFPFFSSAASTSPSPSPPSDEISCEDPIWWFQFHRKRICRAQQELRNKYLDSISAIALLLLDLQKVISKAASIQRDIDGTRMRAIATSVAQAASEERCLPSHLSSNAEKQQARSSWSWFTSLFHSQAHSQQIEQDEKEERSRLREIHSQRLDILSRITALANSTIENLDIIDSILLERTNDIKQLSAYLNARDLRRVEKGNPDVRQHARGLVDLVVWGVMREVNKVKREEEERKKVNSSKSGNGGEE